jgi:Tfp pilus assembly protein PilO
MNTLQKQIDRYKHIQWTLGMVMACLAIGFYVFGYRPAVARLETLQLQTQSKQRELDQSQNKARTLPILVKEVQELEKQVEIYDRQFPRQPQIGEFIRDMTQISQQLSLKNWNYKPAAPKRTEGFYELPIMMSFQGDFMNVSSFLRQVEKLQRLTRVKRLLLKNRDPRTGLVEVEMAMNIYFSEG